MSLARTAGSDPATAGGHRAEIQTQLCLLGGFMLSKGRNLGKKEKKSVQSCSPDLPLAGITRLVDTAPWGAPALGVRHGRCPWGPSSGSEGCRSKKKTQTCNDVRKKNPKTIQARKLLQQHNTKLKVMTFPEGPVPRN